MPGVVAETGLREPDQISSGQGWLVVQERATAADGSWCQLLMEQRLSLAIQPTALGCVWRARKTLVVTSCQEPFSAKMPYSIPDTFVLQLLDWTCRQIRAWSQW
jgi:hypothetical protein